MRVSLEWDFPKGPLQLVKARVLSSHCRGRDGMEVGPVSCLMVGDDFGGEDDPGVCPVRRPGKKDLRLGYLKPFGKGGIPDPPGV